MNRSQYVEKRGKEKEGKASGMRQYTHAHAMLRNDTTVSERRNTTRTKKTETNAAKQTNQRSELKSIKQLNASRDVRTGARLICPAIKNTEAAEGSLARPSIPQTICFLRM